eukprot:c23417_g3_i2 orf=35-739(+)
MASTSPLPDVSSTSDSTSSPQSSSDHPSPDHRIDIHDAPVPDKSSKEQVLRSIIDSIPHSMKLRQLRRSDRNHQKEASDHKKAVRRLSKQLYMIVSLYALVQGTLFAAVAVTNTITCDDWWGPVGIAGTVTLGTLRATLDKLWRMSQKNQEVKIFQKRQNAVFDKIRLLYFKGSACTMEELEPQHTDVFNPAPGFICFFSLHSLLVLGFLVGFSALIITSCTGMLCRPCHCSHP